MEVVTEVPMYTTRTRGGILCEEMGAGKTAICLSLVLLTKSVRSTPEDSNPLISEDAVVPRSILTDLSLRYSRTTDNDTVRDRLEIPQPNAYPSLAEYVLDAWATSTTHDWRIKYSDNLDDLAPMQHQLPSLLPFYLHVNDATTRMTGRPKTKRTQALDPTPTASETCRLPKKMYLSTATLVAVPLSLYEQWKKEIYKFCKDQSLLFRLLADKEERKFPDARELVNLDVSGHSPAYAWPLTPSLYQLILVTIESQWSKGSSDKR